MSAPGESMRVVVRALLVAVALAGAVIEVWAVRSGWSWVSAALDLLAGWSLVAAAGWAMHVTGGCRALLGLSGVCWFLATPQVVGGPVGHDAALLGAVWLAPLATALLGSPDAGPGPPVSACRGRRHLGSRASGASRDRLADRRDGRVPGCCRAPGRPPLCRPAAASGGRCGGRPAGCGRPARGGGRAWVGG